MPLQHSLMPEAQKKRMLAAALRDQQIRTQGGQINPAAPMQQQRQSFEPLQTPEQMETQYRRRGPSTATQAILSGSSPTIGTVLAKTLAAGFAGHKTRKDEKTRENKLAKAIERQDEMAAAAESRPIASALGDMAPSGMRDKMGYADISDADMLAMTEPDAVRDAAIAEADAEDKRLLDQANIVSQMESREGKAVLDKQNIESQIADRTERQKLTQQRNTIEAAKARQARYAGPTPTGSERKDYLRAHGIEKQFQQLNEMSANMPENVRASMAQPVPDVIMMLPPSGVKRWLEDNLVYNDPEVLKYRIKLAKVEGDYSKLMSGLAVSGHEMENRKTWSPYAEGIDQRNRQLRIENLHDAVREEIGLFDTVYPQMAIERPWETPADELSMINQQQPPQVPPQGIPPQGPPQLPQGQGPVQPPQGGVAQAQQQVGTIMDNAQQMMQEQPQQAPTPTGRRAKNEQGQIISEYSDGSWK